MDCSTLKGIKWAEVATRQLDSSGQFSSRVQNKTQPVSSDLAHLMVAKEMGVSWVEVKLVLFRLSDAFGSFNALESVLSFCCNPAHSVHAMVYHSISPLTFCISLETYLSGQRL